MVFDSLSHNNSIVYPSYSSLRRNFFKDFSGGNGDFTSTMAMCIYPVLRTRVEDMASDRFSRSLVDLTLKNIMERDIPVTDWKEVREVLCME